MSRRVHQTLRNVTALLSWPDSQCPSREVNGRCIDICLGTWRNVESTEQTFYPYYCRLSHIGFPDNTSSLLYEVHVKETLYISRRLNTTIMITLPVYPPYQFPGYLLVMHTTIPVIIRPCHFTPSRERKKTDVPIRLWRPTVTELNNEARCRLI